VTRKTDEGTRAQARQLYAAGLTTRAIAARLGVDPRTVQRWLGGDTRPRGPRKRPDVPDSKITELREREGLSYAAIAALTGMSATGARSRYWAITGRPRAERQPGNQDPPPHANGAAHTPSSTGHVTGPTTPSTPIPAPD
jgi:DNA-binding transcriptional regulator YiaG